MTDVRWPMPDETSTFGVQHSMLIIEKLEELVRSGGLQNLKIREKIGLI